MFPYKTSLYLDRSLSQPLYLQLTNQFIALIKAGKLHSGTKLIGSRSLSNLLSVHRKTIVACYDELAMQGWVESIPKKGTFIHSNLPVLQQQPFVKQSFSSSQKTSGFSFYTKPELGSAYATLDSNFTYIDDGVSDTRLTPIDDLARIYRRIAARPSIFKELSYGTTYGNDTLRTVLVQYLNETRGLNITKEQLLITWGRQMGVYLATQLLLNEDDIITIGETNYASATITFKNQNANIMTVPVDAYGLNTEAVEKLCKNHIVKALYVTSHHHHPTTVTLSAERRLHLLNLSKDYNFAIIEDDYDYDFNYNHAPILPLASHDVNDHVIYIGSVCKTVAPVFRIGYLIASEAFVDEAAKLRRYIDRQGDVILELAFAEFIKTGDLDRHIRKVLKIYKTRRDVFCKLLKDELAEYFSFEIPKGGMAIWLKLDTQYCWKQLATHALKYKLIIPNWERYDLFDKGHNAIRIGFASLNPNEIVALVSLLKKACQDLK